MNYSFISFNLLHVYEHFNEQYSMTDREREKAVKFAALSCAVYVKIHMCLQSITFLKVKVNNVAVYVYISLSLSVYISLYLSLSHHHLSISVSSFSDLFLSLCHLSFFLHAFYFNPSDSLSSVLLSSPPLCLSFYSNLFICELKLM